jgi:sugar phosphate isomerase/epimerase
MIKKDGAMPELAVSTWSLHRELGAMYPGLNLNPGQREPKYTYGRGSLTLLDVPATVAGLGVPNLEVSHCYFPRTDPKYLDELRRKLDDARVHLLTLLIDEGDIAAADATACTRDLALMRGWIDVAARVGARRVRVIAGQCEADKAGEAVRRSCAGLLALAEYAGARGVEVITENWLALTKEPASLLSILDCTAGAVGLCADFGNYGGPTKYDDLAAILPRAWSIHAKASFSAPGNMDESDFLRCLDLSRDARFSGAYVLIFNSAGDERASLLQMAEIVRPYL